MEKNYINKISITEGEKGGSQSQITEKNNTDFTNHVENKTIIMDHVKNKEKMH